MSYLELRWFHFEYQEEWGNPAHNYPIYFDLQHGDPPRPLT